ncbi:MAG: CotH kinase family protein [Lachnospiraceae bacterium]|nr:CotH kinase family protein [Lachnospiraceae bacterium]
MMVYHMRRRMYRFLLVILLVVIVFIVSYGKEHPVNHGENDTRSLSFSIKGKMEETITPFYSEADDTYYLFLPAYADTKNVKVYFENAERLLVESDGTNYELKRGADIGCLELNMLYQVRYLEADEIQQTINLEVMHSANLPALFIETQSGTMEEVDADKDYQEEGRYTLIGADGTLLFADKVDHITGRGNSTWWYPKKSYGIKLKDDADLLGMGSARSWILLSNVEDNTYLRNKITFDMAIEAGMTGAPESRYVDLYLNNEYHGMYLLCEKIEAGENRIPMVDLGLENKRYNKNIEQSERVGTEKAKGVILGVNPEDISGGYILERDVPSKYIAEISGFQTEILGDRYTIKSPEYASMEEETYIHNLVDEMEKAIVSENGINPDTGKSFSEYIDIQSFAQKYIIEELCKNNGAAATSAYFYKPNDDISTKIFAGPVWDYDKGYGRLYGFDSTPRDLCYNTQRAEGTVLFWYLNRQPEFQEKVKECYRDFFSDYMLRIVDERMDEYVSEMYASADMDVIRWKEIYGELPQYGKRIYPIKDFLLQRKEFLDEVWLQDAELCTAHFDAPEFYTNTYMSVIKGERLMAIPIQDGEEELDDITFDGWYTEDGEPFDVTRPLYEDVTVYANYCD